MKNGMKIITISMACLVLGVCSVQGSIVTDDFESYTAGNSLHNEGAWRDKNTTANQGAFAAATNSPLGAAGSGAVHYVDTDGTASDAAQLRSKYGETTGDVQVQFDFMAVSSASAPFLNIIANDGSNLIRLQLNKSGNNLLYKNAGGNVTLTSTMSLGSWYTYTITTDIANDEWGLVVSDAGGVVSTFSNLETATPGQLGSEELQFTANVNGDVTGTDYYIDNYSVTAVPEPATVGMLGLGALVAVIIRRSRL